MVYIGSLDAVGGLDGIGSFRWSRQATYLCTPATIEANYSNSRNLLDWNLEHQTAQRALLPIQHGNEVWN